MKRKTLLIAALAVAMIPAAGVRAGSWTSPSPTPSALQTGTTCYLYNEASHQFANEGDGGSGWNTQVLLAETGLKFKVAQLADGLYQLGDSSVNKAAWKMVFIDGKGMAYVDGGGRGNDEWAITATAENPLLYTICIDPANATFGTALYPDCFLGWDGTENKVVSPLLNIKNDNASSYGYKWEFISPDAYTVFMARKALYEQLNAAETAGVSTTAAEAVYNDAASTLQQIDDAAASLADAIKNDKFGNATADNPSDITSLIVNANLNDGTGKGWSEGTFKNNECERYDTQFNVSQTLRKMKEGVYKVALQGFYRYGDQTAANTAHGTGEEALNAFLYAGNDSTALQSIFTEAGKLEDGTTSDYGNVPSSMATAQTWFTAGYYGNNALYTCVDGTDTLTLGVKKHVSVSLDWTIFDNFHLLYYGNTPAAYRIMLKTLMDKAAEYGTSSYYGGETEQNAMAEASTSATTAYNDAAATTGSLKTAITSLRTANENFKRSVESYAKLKTALAAGEAASEYDYADLSDYLVDMSSAYDSHSLTADSVEKVVTRIYELIAAAKANALKEGDDCTAYLTNPTFEKNTSTGWTYTSDKKPILSDGVMEFYGTKFDIYQIINKLPNGKFMLKCQLFQRPYDDGTSISKYSAGENDIRCYLYANGSQTPAWNLIAGATETQYATGSGCYDTGLGTYYPHTRNGSSLWFAAGTYEDSVTVVVTDNTLKVGVRYQDTSMSTVGNSWELFDNFHLQFLGRSAEILKPELDKLAAMATSLSDSVMNATVKAQLVEAAKGAASATDAIKAIKTLNTSIAAAQQSIEAYRTLASAILYADTTMARTTASEATTQAYTATMNGIKSSYQNGTYADADIPAAIEAVKMALAKYQMGDITGTPDNPTDVTNIIVNPDFSNGTTGWTEPGTVKASEMEFYDKTFNLSQTIKGLKNGTYRLTVTGFYRDGLAEPASQARNGGTEALNALFYAGDKSTPMLSIFSKTDADTLQHYDTRVLLGTDSVWIANTMDGARVRFDAGYYTDNSVVVDVTDNVLTFGIKKDVAVTKDWTIFDNFRLYYYGTSGADGIETATQGAQLLQTRYYTVGGAMLDKPVKGVNIVRQTYVDGSIKIKKIIVR